MCQYAQNCGTGFQNIDLKIFRNFLNFKFGLLEQQQWSSLVRQASL